MGLLETLQGKKGELIKLKSQLYWYDGVGFDDVPSRICILADAAVSSDDMVATTVAAFTAAGLTVRNKEESVDAVAALLLFDERFHWVWVAAPDVELIDETE